MSNIPSSAQYVQIEGARTRSPVSESLLQVIGGSVNYLLDLAGAGWQTTFFATAGSGLWTVPAGVTNVLVLGCGGGGGGGGGTNTISGPSGTFATSPGGGAGARPMLFTSTVTPGSSVSYTIASGGVGGSSSNGGGGGTSRFSGVHFPGGNGGTVDGVGGGIYLPTLNYDVIAPSDSIPGGMGVYPIYFYDSGLGGINIRAGSKTGGSQSAYAVGGSSGTGGGGGGGSIGPGGNGNGSAGSSGGGGGGGVSTGGNGGNGYIQLWWRAG